MPVLEAVTCSSQGSPTQVKRSRNGYQKLYRELEHVAGLFLRADGRGWIVALDGKRFLELLAAVAEKEASK